MALVHAKGLEFVNFISPSKWFEQGVCVCVWCVCVCVCVLCVCVCDRDTERVVVGGCYCNYISNNGPMFAMSGINLISAFVTTRPT